MMRRKKWIGSCENEILGFFSYVCACELFFSGRYIFLDASLTMLGEIQTYMKFFKSEILQKIYMLNDILLIIRKWLCFRLDLIYRNINSSNKYISFSFIIFAQNSIAP